MIEIERPKTAIETPAIASAIPRNGFMYDSQWREIHALKRIAYMISRIVICFRLSARVRLFQYVFTKCPVALSLIQPVILRALHAHADRMPFARNYVCAELWISYKACQVG